MTKQLWTATIIDSADFGRTLWQGYSLDLDKLTDIAADKHLAIIEKMDAEWRAYVNITIRSETLL